MAVARGALHDRQDHVEDIGGPKRHLIHDIIAGIYDGRYKPGQRLTEAQLTADYGVSRGSVREALQRLVVTGLIELAPQRGAQIRKLSLDEALGTLVVVRTLAGLAARAAAEKIDTPGAAERIETAMRDLLVHDPASGTASYAIARDAFYSALADIGGNVELKRALATMQTHLIRVQFRQAMGLADERRHVDYRQIADAVLAGRPGLAEAAMHAHLDLAMLGMRGMDETDTI